MNRKEVIDLIEEIEVFKLILTGHDLGCALINIHGRDSAGKDYIIEVGFLVDYFVVKDILGKKLLEVDFNEDENRYVLQLVETIFKKIDLDKISKNLKKRLKRLGEVKRDE